MFWIIFLVTAYVVVLTDWMIEITGHPRPDTGNTFLMLGYCKAGITFVKYLP